MQIVGVQRHVIKERTVGHLYNILLVHFWYRIVLKNFEIAGSTTNRTFRLTLSTGTRVLPRLYDHHATLPTDQLQTERSAMLKPGGMHSARIQQ